ncbi:unnamed protein product, partial [Schistosoma curassoni]|uniref:Uncharacterized protein n=1 Tax=Schistosoma curassoni TaxID=6186 RepID=A0A183KJ38_9TREM
MHHTRKQIALHAIDWLTFGLQTDGGGVKATTSPRFTQKISTTQPFLPEDSTPESMFMTVKILEKPEVCASEVTEGVIDKIPLTVSSRLSWTWREGRMRMYYLVARSLVGLHLKALHELDADGYNPMNSEDFCISPTFTDDCPQRTLYTSSNNNLHQFGFSPVPKSIPPALVSNPDRRAPVNK